MKKRIIIQPKWNAPCFCGSGRKYKSCCKYRLPGFEIGKKYSTLIKEESKLSALLAARADFCQYTIWHKTNTQPMILKSDTLALPRLLEVDVNALGEYLLRLVELYWQNNKSEQLDRLFENIESNILHPKWRRKVTYVRAVNELAFKQDRQKAKQVFSALLPITDDEPDVEILQMFVDFYFGEISFSERIKYLDQLLSASSAQSDQIQYGLIKSLQYFLIGDDETSKALLSISIENLENSTTQEILSDYELLFLARSKNFLGFLKRSKKLHQEAVEQYADLLKNETLTKSTRSIFLLELGECYKHIREFALAEEAFKEAINLDESEILKVKLAEIELKSKSVDAALATISSVKKEELSKEEHEDYVFAKANMAIASKSSELLTSSLKNLEDLKLGSPYFREYCYDLKLSISKLLAGEKVSESKITKFSDMFIFQPNFFGIGINFNEIIRGISERNKSKNINS